MKTNFTIAYNHLGEQEKCLVTALLLAAPNVATSKVAAYFNGTFIADIHIFFARAMQLLLKARLTERHHGMAHIAALEMEAAALLHCVGSAGLQPAAARAFEFLEHHGA
jgi:hypothetical protein